MEGDLSGVPDQFKAWAALGNIPGQPSDLSGELLEGVRPYIDEGKVRVETESDKYYQLIGSKYPIGVNRIDWRGVRGHLELNVLPEFDDGIPRETERTLLADCRDVLLGWLHSVGVDLQDKIIWTGDETKVSLHMTIEIFLALFPQLFTFPQHHYVLPPDGQWCLNYTMEGQLFWGKAANAVVRGYVELDTPDDWQHHQLNQAAGSHARKGRDVR